MSVLVLIARPSLKNAVTFVKQRSWAIAQ